MKRFACPYCRRSPVLVRGDVIYPGRADLKGLSFWQCAPCVAYVGCHKAGNGFGDGTRPLGTLANAELRLARNKAHAAFDPIWRSAEMNRRKAYAWLASHLGLSVKRVHIAEFDLERCSKVISICAKRVTCRPMAVSG